MTSDERREMAARLREFADTDVWLGVMFAELKRFGDTDRPSADAIADFIDPTCHMDAVDTGEQADYECRERIMHCSNCNAEFGYVLYGEDGDVSMDDKPKFCPECGKRVVDGDADGAR